MLIVDVSVLPLVSASPALAVAVKGGGGGGGDGGGGAWANSFDDATSKRQAAARIRLAVVITTMSLLS